MISLLADIPWEQAVLDLRDRGWTRVACALGAEVVDQLAYDDTHRWRVPGDEPVVHQHAYGSYLPFAEARPEVRQAGADLVAGLTAAAGRFGLPPVPGFNEARWGRSPSGVGRVSAQRDPPEYGGVIAVFTLRGRATFRVIDPDRALAEWETAPGHIVILRGAGWPRRASRCPPHDADWPPDGERLIMTLRHNSGGAGYAG
jgi:hypothetical protein